MRDVLLEVVSVVSNIRCIMLDYDIKECMLADALSIHHNSYIAALSMCGGNITELDDEYLYACIKYTNGDLEYYPIASINNKFTKNHLTIISFIPLLKWHTYQNILIENHGEDIDYLYDIISSINGKDISLITYGIVYNGILYKFKGFIDLKVAKNFKNIKRYIHSHKNHIKKYVMENKRRGVLINND